MIKSKALTSSHEFESSSGWKKGKNKTIKRILTNWQVYLFLLLPLIYILVYNYYPMLGLQIAFKDFNVKKTKRINIDYAEEAKDFLWRYILCK